MDGELAGRRPDSPTDRPVSQSVSQPVTYPFPLLSSHSPAGPAFSAPQFLSVANPAFRSSEHQTLLLSEEIPTTAAAAAASGGLFARDLSSGLNQVAALSKHAL